MQPSKYSIKASPGYALCLLPDQREFTPTYRSGLDEPRGSSASLVTCAPARQWSLDVGQTELALGLCCASWRFWVMRGAIREGRDWMERALHLVETAAPSLRARTLNVAGNLALSAAALEEAHALYRRALVLWRELEDRDGIARALHNLGRIAVTRCQLAAAREHYTQSLELKRQFCNTYQVAMTVCALATVLRYQGNFEQARVLYEEGFAVHRAEGDGWGMAHSLKDLAWLAHAQGEYARAKELACRSIVCFRDLDSRPGIAEGLEALAAVALSQGDLIHATHLLGAAGGSHALTGGGLPAREPIDRERMLATAQTVLGESTFTATLQQAERWTLDQLIEYGVAHRPEKPADALRSPLTQREREVVVWIGRGLTNVQLARHSPAPRGQHPGQIGLFITRPGRRMGGPPGHGVTQLAHSL